MIILLNFKFFLGAVGPPDKNLKFNCFSLHSAGKNEDSRDATTRPIFHEICTDTSKGTPDHPGGAGKMWPTDPLEEQILAYETRLIEVEQKLSQFKQNNSELIFYVKDILHAHEIESEYFLKKGANPISSLISS